VSSARIQARRRFVARVLSLGFFAALLVGCVMVARPVVSSAQPGGALTVEPIAKAAAAGAERLFGASPGEAPGEVWGVGEAENEGVHIIRYTDASGWEALPDPIGPAGETVALERNPIPRVTSAGRTTPAGGVVTVATIGEGETAKQYLIVRDPGGALRAVPAPEPEPVVEEPPVEEPPTKEPGGEEPPLKEGEGEKPTSEEPAGEEPGGEKPTVEEPAPPKEPLLEPEERPFPIGEHAPVKIAAVEEPDGKTGAFVVPDPPTGKPVTGVLHYDGSEWHREKICPSEIECGKPLSGFVVLAIEAGGPGQLWILARRTGKGKSPIVLLHREEGAWKQQVLGGPLGSIFSIERPKPGGTAVTIAAREKGQPLTVTSKGVWVDATVTFKGLGFDATIYYDVGEGDARKGEVTGSWCDPPEELPEAARPELCAFPLGSRLATEEDRSFAWPGNGGPGEEFGTRAITGIGQGSLLVFENGAWSKIPLGGSGGTTAGAALSSTSEGWIGPSSRLTREAIPSGLQAWPVPFRHPLLAVAPQPGAAVGELSSQALAVGAAGEVARYLPGVGWQPESLLSGSGLRATPTLRGVAWPTPEFAYAVGDEGAMWMWRGSTGLWEPDPGSPPNLIRGNFTGIAFDPEEPERGYAVGKQGLLLEYGKRWTQVKLPESLNPESNITSIAFAGHEAIATWTLAVKSEASSAEPKYTGGVIVNDGSGWRTEEAATAALLEVENEFFGIAPRRVAGLPDGGAVIVGIRGGVIEREAAGAPWHAVPGTLVGYPDAVAAIREGGQVRAVLSVGENLGELEVDRAQAFGQPAEGQPPLATEPYPLPRRGSLIRQTATGWRDEQRDVLEGFPTSEKLLARAGRRELPVEPDPILALLLSGDGSQGWALGGQTGQGVEKFYAESVQTAAAERYGAAAAPPVNATAAPLSVNSGEATFAVGGGAQCEETCAERVNAGSGPEVWLPAAVGRAAAIPGVRAFLYTGGGVAEELDQTKVSRQEFSEEEGAYAHRLGLAAGALPVFAPPAPSDRYASSLSAFEGAFAGFPAPLGASTGFGVTPYAGREAANESYSFTSSDELGGNLVRVVVLDESVAPTPSANVCWLGGQLADAKREGIPAIVVGVREAQTEPELEQVLVTGAGAACPQPEPGAASAYFYSQVFNESSARFEKIEGNISATLSSGSVSIPTYGTGSLGFLEVPNPTVKEQDVTSGFLLASVNVAGRSPQTNIAPVSVRLIPNIASLAINALDGTLLRRSQTALFEALARRPIAGFACRGTGNEGCVPSPDPYIPIPNRCVAGHGYKGRPCGLEIQAEYRFTSSRPDIANFVEVDPTSANPRTVFLDGSGKPVADPTSGLLCAFNSGTTVVTVETGGLAYSVPVVVQAGSVARPCGTVPRTDISPEEKALETPPPPVETEPGFKPGTKSFPPPPPHFQPQVQPTPPVHLPQVNPTAPVVHPVQPHPVPKPAPQSFAPPFIFNSPTIAPVPVIIPPAPPAAAEPAPPTGTSPVTQPAVSPEPEEEEEAAFDLVHHAVAYLPGNRRSPALQAVGSPAGYRVSNLLPAVLVLFAAIAFTGIAGPRLRRSPEPAFNRNRQQRRPFDGQS
jgi:hypothetical protein